MMTLLVKIDGELRTLTLDRPSGARGLQYLTEGNAESHAFAFHLAPGQRFRTNGHAYEVIGAAQ